MNPNEKTKNKESYKEELSSTQTLSFAAQSGLAIAAIYYTQPILGMLGAKLGVSDQIMGMVPTMTQTGFALGILLLVPLGDCFDRRKVILAKIFIMMLALLATAMAPSIHVILATSLVIGITATLGQDIVPAAAHLTPEHQRGKVVGTVMTGILLGIILSRVASGLIAAHFGWRTVFYAAAASMALGFIQSYRIMPHFEPATKSSYGQLLFSLIGLWKEHQPLRRAALAQGLLAIGFSGFWSTLAIMLYSAPYHLGSDVAGMYGLAGAAGALAAPMVGKRADKCGPHKVAVSSLTIATCSFAIMFILPYVPPYIGVWIIGLSAVGFDLGAQSTLIAHQTIIFGLDPEARSRVNAILFIAISTGMAVGSATSSFLQVHWGWSAVTGLAVLSGLSALAVRLYPTKTQSTQPLTQA